MLLLCLSEILSSKVLVQDSVKVRQIENVFLIFVVKLFQVHGFINYFSMTAKLIYKFTRLSTLFLVQT